MTDDDPTPTRPAWATPAITETLEKAILRSSVVALQDTPHLTKVLLTALGDEDLVIIPDQHVDVVRYEDLAGQHRWRALDDRNGQTIADSAEGYVSTTHCAHMAERLFPTANTTTKENPTT